MDTWVHFLELVFWVNDIGGSQEELSGVSLKEVQTVHRNCPDCQQERQVNKTQWNLLPAEGPVHSGKWTMVDPGLYPRKMEMGSHWPGFRAWL